MTRKAELGKTFSRASGSLNAPIAAFTMAVILCTYCISSINTARREASSSATATTRSQRISSSDQSESQQSWVQQALDESRNMEGKKGSK